MKQFIFIAALFVAFIAFWNLASRAERQSIISKTNKRIALVSTFCVLGLFAVAAFSSNFSFKLF